MRAAQLNENSIVVNFVEVAGFDGVHFVEPLDSVIGSIWNGQIFTPPAPDLTQHNTPILAELAAIDAKSIRALREGDLARIAALEAQAAALRAQLMK